jgi:hypothetical protein
MRLPKFLQRKSREQRKSRNWLDRVDFWPTGHPHYIATYTEVAAMQHIMHTGGIGNSVAIDRLLKDEKFWWELSSFFQDKVNELGEIEFVAAIARLSTAIREVGLYCWDVEDTEVHSWATNDKRIELSGQNDGGSHD